MLSSPQFIHLILAGFILTNPIFSREYFLKETFLPPKKGQNKDKATASSCLMLPTALPLFCLLEKIKGEIENNIEMKSHLLDLRNHFLNRYMSCIIGKNKFSFVKPTLLNKNIVFASY